MITSTRFAHKLVALGIGATMLWSCSSDKHDEQADQQVDTSALTEQSGQPSKSQEFFQSLPSPIHISRIFQRAGLKYLSGYTNPADNASKYMSPYSRSVNMGIYTTDLAYCTFSDQTQEAISYFKAIKTLTDGLNMSSIFENTNLVPRFEKNLGNKDSLVMLMSDLSMESDILLKQTSRLDVAYLSFAGAWTESMYIATQILKKAKNPELSKRVADQEGSLEKLIILLQDYQDKKEFSSLIASLSEVKGTLEKINNGNGEEDFGVLTTQIETLRNKLTSEI
jgi:hypothetical protein